jgi:hypothetical protein
MKKEFWLIIILAIIIIVLTPIVFFWKTEKQDVQNPNVKNISVNQGQEVKSPLSIEGEAKGNWFFEASFPIKILDEQGNVLGNSFAAAQSDWMTEDFVPFKGEISFNSEKEQKGFLVLQKDNPSDLPEFDEEIIIPVFLKPTEYIKIKVFFSNNNLDPEILCNKVFAAEREILKIEAIGAAAINELLNGPTETEKQEGFFTNINFGVRLLGLDIDKDGVARVDFDQQLQAGVGGSCKVAAIRAQITETLKQFSTIKNVIISINGSTEDILQP